MYKYILTIISIMKFCLCFLTSEMMSKSCSNSEGQPKSGIYFLNCGSIEVVQLKRCQQREPGSVVHLFK